MALPAFRTLARHPAAVAARLVLWPTAILVLSNLAANGQDDPLGAGLTGFAVVAAACFVLALADGLVLLTRPLVVVWSITSVVLVGLLLAQPLVDAALHGLRGGTWAETIQIALSDVPSSSVVFLVLVGVPVTLGAVAGSALRRSVTPPGGQMVSAKQLGAPRP